MVGKGRYSLGKDNRSKGENNFVPGPGSYDNRTTQLRDAKGKISFGKDQKLKFDTGKNPGPGQYDLKPTFADVPKYLLPGK